MQNIIKLLHSSFSVTMCICIQYIPRKLCKTCLFETNLLLVLKIDFRIVRWLREIESCIAWNKQCFVMFNISAILNPFKYILFVDLVLADK